MLFKFKATLKQTPGKSQTITQYKNRRPIDISSHPSNFSIPPAKYYNKTLCCPDTFTTKDVFGDVRTCPKVIGGSTKCIPLNANSNINANVPVDSNGVLTKKYYTSNKEYMKSRCMTYDQKAFHYAPFSGTSGEANCCNTIGNYVSGNCQTSIYKRSNPTFSKQGAVSASNRLLRLKYNTITASSGNNRANCPSCVKYPGSQTQNVYLKQNKCFRVHRTGNKTIC